MKHAVDLNDVHEMQKDKDKVVPVLNWVSRHDEVSIA